MASHTFPAAIVIADARLYAGQPITEDLMMDLRDRDQDAADTGLENRVLYNIGGAYYAGGEVQICPATRTLPGGAGSEPMWWVRTIQVPPEVAQVSINIFAACTVNNLLHYFRLYKDGVLTGDEWKSLPNLANIAWQAEKTVAVTPGGTHYFTIEYKQDAGAAGGTCYLRGVRILTV